MPEAIRSAFECPRERQNYPRATQKIVGDDACDHDQKIAGVEPEEFPPRIFRLPVRAHFVDEASSKEGFVKNVDNVRRHHRPEDEYQGQGGLFLVENVQTRRTLPKSIQIGKVRGTKRGTKMSIWSRPGRPRATARRNRAIRREHVCKWSLRLAAKIDLNPAMWGCGRSSQSRRGQ
jgi:hypothetical protein